MDHCFSEELFLKNKTGSYLYHTYAETLPIVDYHCHLAVQEIYENKEFEDIGEMWLAHDHYKWRAMRTFGIDEYYVTGGASYYEKYMKFAEILPRLMGNPLYIWCALELKRYFDIDEPLSLDNARDIYKRTKDFIRENHMTPRWCMERSHVELVSTTEDPVDTLEYHFKLREEGCTGPKIITAFRPDKAFYCENPVFPEYQKQLSGAAGLEIHGFTDMIAALEKRLSFFRDFGTTVSDDGIEDFTWEEYTVSQVEEVYRKAAKGEALTRKEQNRFKSAFMVDMGKLYNKYGFVMQLHIGTYQDANHRKVREIGRSTGFDCTDDSTAIQSVGALLNRLTELGELPKTILYPLDPSKLETFAVLAAGFCDGSFRGKVQLGAPWWFNDQPYGIERQFHAAGNLYAVSLSVGMLTDSRSFLSYPRHELYRRGLCSYLGELVERGEYFSDEKYLKEVIEDVCYRNVKRFFGWDKQQGNAALE